MLTGGLKVSYLPHKCVFHRSENVRGDPMELNFEGLQMKKWKIPTDRAERVDEKNEIIFAKSSVEMLDIQVNYWKIGREIAEEPEMLWMLP